MNTLIPMWTAVTTMLVAAYTGFWLGRSSTVMVTEQGEEPERENKKRGKSVVKPPRGREVASPAAGSVGSFYEGMLQGAVIQSTQGKLYAPASGKIIKVYPMGCAFLLRTDYGVELLLQAGKPEDELLGEYYRPRVVCNEIVSKGKLLLEYDRDALLTKGVDTSIYVSVNAPAMNNQVTLTQADTVRVGEQLLWVL
ncbi:MAG: PTS glucose transporter subunit IIA [Roseburia sp.]|nr:PTS glucose transporter subunit IIA [Roseburia sp.]